MAKKQTKLKPFITEPEPGLKVRHDGIYQHVVSDNREHAKLTTPDELLNHAIEKQQLFLENLDNAERGALEALKPHIVFINDKKSVPYPKELRHTIPGMQPFQVKPGSPPIAQTAIDVLANASGLRCNLERGDTSPINLQWIISTAMLIGSKYHKMQVQQVEYLALAGRNKVKRNRIINAKRSKRNEDRNKKIVADISKHLERQQRAYKSGRQAKEPAANRCFPEIAEKYDLSTDSIKTIWQQRQK